MNISKKKGVAKQPAVSIMLKEGLGVRGDAHCGPGDRQVSLLAIESYRRFEESGRPCLKQGSFGENIVTEGIELHTQPLGTRFAIGDALLEVSKIGKECHAPCAIGRQMGECIMPKEGIFMRVVKGGRISAGMPISRE